MKQGRNEMCNCGSGKKFKKCCIHNISNTTEKLVNDVSIEIRHFESPNLFKRVIT